MKRGKCSRGEYERRGKREEGKKEDREWGSGTGDWEDEDFVSAFGTGYPVIFLAKAQRRRGRKGKKRVCSSSANSAPLSGVRHGALLRWGNLCPIFG